MELDEEGPLRLDGNVFGAEDLMVGRGQLLFTQQSFNEFIEMRELDLFFQFREIH